MAPHNEATCNGLQAGGSTRSNPKLSVKSVQKTSEGAASQLLPTCRPAPDEFLNHDSAVELHHLRLEQQERVPCTEEGAQQYQFRQSASLRSRSLQHSETQARLEPQCRASQNLRRVSESQTAHDLACLKAPPTPRNLALPKGLQLCLQPRLLSNLHDTMKIAAGLVSPYAPLDAAGSNCSSSMSVALTFNCGFGNRYNATGRLCTPLRTQNTSSKKHRSGKGSQAPLLHNDLDAREVSSRVGLDHDQFLDILLRVPLSRQPTNLVLNEDNCRLQLELNFLDSPQNHPMCNTSHEHHCLADLRLRTTCQTADLLA
mmetsp:Transcript_11456/g.25446  ORF Transcript_11456/g.25446 Transcript_11456/m.25446 type:complete len:315 (-) Transcript_11456:1091-2035(-)